MDKYQKVAVHGYIKREDGKFLVTKRSEINDYLPNYYDLSGGTVEFGEDPKKALQREILEETNLKVEIFNPIFVFSEIQNEVRHQIWIIYECKYLGGDITLNPDEHSEYKWVNLNEVNNLSKIVFLDELLKFFNY